MATEGRLPLYNKVRQIFDQFEMSTRKNPVNIKRGIVAVVENQLIEVLVLLSYAEEVTGDDCAEGRMDLIDRIGAILKEVRIRIRVMHDLKFMKDTGFDALGKLQKNADDQLAGWRNKTEKIIEKR